tara:strand:- start:693 stop:848 length:156 start_codon:yes stop_codon:yes gene_type:complete
MQKILPLVFAVSVSSSSVLAWGEGGCSLSKKNKTSKEATTEKIEKSDYSDN